MDKENNILEEDMLRADMYDFISNLLRKEPSKEFVEKVALLKGDETLIGKSTITLAHLAKQIDISKIREEFFNLFIGIGRGELLPYGSYYLTGFLNEKPLANLRQDMERIGIKKNEKVKEPEDHISSLFDMMSGLIRGKFKRPFSLVEQGTFFKKHIEPWSGHFFGDLEVAKNAVFYAPVGTLGKIFIQIEIQSYQMEKHKEF